ncbi:MAG TPA: hypothetical protein VM901_12945 [Bdellovibrionota bacterium]|jgi:hypothetical protein|nr:hypothetical protein [Bdellovibrionota bacterium]
MMLAPLFGIPAQAAPDPVCIHYLEQVAQALVNPYHTWETPLASLRAAFPADPYPPVIKKLEDELIHMYTEVPPGARRWDDFAERWGFERQTVDDLQAFYGLNFFDFPGLVSDRIALLQHIQSKVRQIFLASAHPAAERYPYYFENAGLLSVPEMAAHLGISEGEVYRDLSLVGISLAKLYEEHPDLLERATQAAAFGRHHQGVENRGVSWNRILSYRGFKRVEAEILIDLFDEGMTHAEIARTLNGIAEIHSAEDAEIRTEASVSAKIMNLGLAQRARESEKDISISPYGMIKQSGRLVPSAAIEFLWDHRDRSLEWCAEQMGVQAPSLRSFLDRQHLSTLLGTRAAETAPATSPHRPSSLIDEAAAKVIASKFAEIEEAIFALHYAIKTSQRVPSTKINPKTQTSPLTDALGFTHGKFTGTGNWSPDNQFRHKRMHDSPVDAFEHSLALVDRNPNLSASERAAVKKILSEKIDELRFERLSHAEQRTQLTLKFQNAVASLGAVPTSSNGSAWRGKNFLSLVGINHNKFYGTGKYAPNTKGYALRYYDSPLDAFRSAKATLGQNKSLSPDAITVVDKALSERIASIEFEALTFAEKRNHAARLLHAAILKNKSFPRQRPDDSSLISLKEIFPFSETRFFGIDAYAPGGESHESRLFDSVPEALDYTLKAVKTNTALSEADRATVNQILEMRIGQREQFEQVPRPGDNRPKYLASELDDLRRDGAFKIHQAILRDLKIPALTATPTPTPNLQDVLGYEYTRFSGTGSHGLGSDRRHLRLFDDFRAALEYVLKTVNDNEDLDAKQRTTVRKIIEARIEEMKFDELPLADQRRTAAFRLHSSIGASGKYPSTDRNPTSKTIPLSDALKFSYHRLYGLQSYADGKPSADLRLYDSELAALTDIHAMLGENQALKEDTRKIVEKILDARMASLRFDTLPLGERRLQIALKLQNHIAVHGKVPSTTIITGTRENALSNALGIPFHRYYGTNTYKTAPSRLYDSPQAALRDASALLERNESLSPEQRKAIATVLETKAKSYDTKKN